MNLEEVKNLRINYAANVLDGAFFGFGIGFASFSTVIPLFVATMTDSATLIGLIAAVHLLGWQVPQLIMANSVARLPRFKPMVMLMTIQERLPFLGLALIALFIPRLGVTLALVLTYLMLIWQGLGAGFTANAWQNMISRVIPSEYLATFFGMQSAAANLLGSGAAIMAGLILERQTFPLNYAQCFLLTSAMLVISFIFLGITRESPRRNVISRESQIPLMKSIKSILKRDRNFVWFLVSRTVAQFGVMAFGFYTVYAVTRLGAGEVQVGVLTSVLLFTQVISNPVMGWLADRWSRKGVLELGAAAIMVSCLLAWFAPTVAWLYPAMILAGMANTAFWTIFMAFSMQFGTDDERPTYIGMANSFIAPATIIAPLIGGWLADTSSYQATFIMAACAGLLATLIFHFLVRDPVRKIA
jgi:MFS family permease